MEVLKYLLARIKTFASQHPLRALQYHKKTWYYTGEANGHRKYIKSLSQVSSLDTAEPPLEHAGRGVSSVNCILALSASVLIQVESIQHLFFFFFLIYIETFEILEDPNRDYTLTPFQI